MYYICLDLEWNQWQQGNEVKRELLQIALILHDATLKETRRVYRIIRPDHISRVSAYTMRSMHLNPKILAEASVEQEVLRVIRKYIQEEDVLVLWSHQAADLLMEVLQRHEIPFSRERVMILSDVTARILRRRMGFEEALRYFEIPYSIQKLHCSKHDVAYLAALFHQIVQIEQTILQNATMGSTQV